MYAVIRSGGKQYRVASGETIQVEKLDGKIGDKVTFGVRPEHLEPVTRTENLERRGHTARPCPHGFPWSPVSAWGACRRT